MSVTLAVHRVSRAVFDSLPGDTNMTGTVGGWKQVRLTDELTLTVFCYEPPAVEDVAAGDWAQP